MVTVRPQQELALNEVLFSSFSIPNDVAQDKVGL